MELAFNIKLKPLFSLASTTMNGVKNVPLP